MSLIEKAVNRMGGVENASPDSQGGPQLQESTVAASLIERAVEAPVATVEEGKRQKSNIKSGGRQISIDLERLASLGFLVPDAEKSQIAEEFRVVKRPLITNVQAGDALEKHRNLIMVTSSLPGEGKSFCALNLALSIAMERDITVMLVDADVAKPSVLNNLGLRAEAGLMDLLLDRSLQGGDVLLKTNIEKFSILPAGRRHKHATELLASEAPVPEPLRKLFLLSVHNLDQVRDLLEREALLGFLVKQSHASIAHPNLWVQMPTYSIHLRQGQLARKRLSEHVPQPGLKLLTVYRLKHLVSAQD